MSQQPILKIPFPLPPFHPSELIAFLSGNGKFRGELSFFNRPDPAGCPMMIKLPITTKVARRVEELEKEIERRDEDETKIRMGKW